MGTKTRQAKSTKWHSNQFEPKWLRNEIRILRIVRASVHERSTNARSCRRVVVLHCGGCTAFSLRARCQLTVRHARSITLSISISRPRSLTASLYKKARPKANQRQAPSKAAVGPKQRPKQKQPHVASSCRRMHTVDFQLARPKATSALTIGLPGQRPKPATRPKATKRAALLQAAMSPGGARLPITASLV